MIVQVGIGVQGQMRRKYRFHAGRQVDLVFEKPLVFRHLDGLLMPGVQPSQAGGHDHLAAVRIMGEEAQKNGRPLRRWGWRRCLFPAANPHCPLRAPMPSSRQMLVSHIYRLGLGVVGRETRAGQYPSPRWKKPYQPLPGMPVRPMIDPMPTINLGGLAESTSSRCSNPRTLGAVSS